MVPRLIIAFFIFLFVGLTGLLIHIHQEDSKYDQACKAAGGYTYWPYKSRPICLDPKNIKSI